MAHRPQYCEIAFVVDFLNRCVVSVNAKDQHCQVVGSEGYSVNSLVDKLVDQQYCCGNLYHDPEFEVGASLQSLLFEDFPRVPEVLKRPDERQHHVDVGEFVLFSNFLDSSAL